MQLYKDQEGLRKDGLAQASTWVNAWQSRFKSVGLDWKLVQDIQSSSASKAATATTPIE